MTGSALSPLTFDEQLDLGILEQTIDEGISKFFVVGKALLQIRERRLYRATHTSFEAYLGERWEMSDATATRMVQAAKVVEALPIGSGPANEAQARELAPLLPEPEKLREAWQEATANGPPTARSVREAVNERRPRPERAESERRVSANRRPPIDRTAKRVARLIGRALAALDEIDLLLGEWHGSEALSGAREALREWEPPAGDAA